MSQQLSPAEFFASHSLGLIEAARCDGAEGAVAFIQRFGTLSERLMLYTQARKVFVLGEGSCRDLDVAGGIADAGIDEVEQAITALGPTDDIVRVLHILNFNLAADLADSWPDDGLIRGRRHFARGLAAAEALHAAVFEGRLEPRIVSNDHWVKGMHRLSLGDAMAALASWETASKYAAEAAAAQGNPAGPSEASTFQANLIAGYVALGRWLTAVDDAAISEAVGGYACALAAFEGQSRHWAVADEAEFGILQLEAVRKRYAPGLPRTPPE